MINCIGLIKQAKTTPIAAISINALLPHRLAELTGKAAATLIHFSTDCVFSGANGPYSEMTSPTPLIFTGALSFSVRFRGKAF